MLSSPNVPTDNLDSHAQGSILPSYSKELEEYCQFSVVDKVNAPLSRNSQEKLEHKENKTKCRKMTRKPRGHVRTLIYRKIAAYKPISL